uniref:Transcription cofactor HES-6 n=2 Tax=Kryptolebias marmoratus TaxID=37003 RepID=A0A3Q3AJ40_KRYMA
MAPDRTERGGSWVRPDQKVSPGGRGPCAMTAPGSTRKPLVEKRRRTRINESLRELRVLITDSDVQSKMENAEVLEVTVKQVESILQNRAQEVDALNREASERFAAGYIQCMHDVHTFVSGCTGMEPAVAAELLNQLLESMPLNDELRADGCTGPGPLSPHTSPVSPASPAPSSASTDELASDLEEADSEPSRGSSSGESDRQPSLTLSPSPWRPW